jgi:chromosome segregation protein
MAELKLATVALAAVQSDADEQHERDSELADVNFRLEQFDKHGVKTKLEKQVDVGRRSERRW